MKEGKDRVIGEVGSGAKAFAVLFAVGIGLIHMLLMQKLIPLLTTTTTTVITIIIILGVSLADGILLIALLKALVLKPTAKVEKIAVPRLEKIPSLEEPSGLLTIGFKILGDFSVKLVPFRERLRKKIVGSAMRIPYQMYFAGIVFWTIVSVIISGVVGYYISPFLKILFPYPIIMNYLWFWLPLIISPLVFVTLFSYPFYVAGKLKREIEKNLVYITNYMTILSSAGAITEEIFASLEKVGEVYGIKPVAKRIISEVQLVGKDIFTVLDEESKRNPSRLFAELLQGFIATVRSGGNPEHYLVTMSEKYIEIRRRVISKVINQLNLAAEIYVAALVALPIILTTMLTIMGLLGGPVVAGLSAGQMLTLLTYIILPMTASAILIYIDAILSL